jgi:acyl dehydratase
MNILEVASLDELAGHVGETLGPSDWLAVDQALIDDFARVTNDLSWYHVDIARAAREMPGGHTIAHGLLILSLVPGLTAQFLTIRDRGRALNYGSNKVRYIAPVIAGASVRLSMTIASVTSTKGGHMLQTDYIMELLDGTRPAMIAEVLTLMYD